jgi:predicted metalloprotease
LLALAVAAPLIASACGAEPLVTVERADRIAPGGDEPVFQPDSDTGNSADTVPNSDQTDQTDPAVDPTGSVPDPPPTDPPPADPPPTDPPPSTVPIDPDAIDFGFAKPPQPYDDFLLATIADIETWWTEQFPALYGEPFRPLEGRIIAAYPGRPDDIPGCGTPRTTYDEVREFAAFYCGVGDFMVYDDGDGGLLANLAERFGPATISIVLAHEYGHAIQLRIGAFDSNLATITTEQQADCFAGAWSARAANGESSRIRFSDDDIRAGLISMLEVRDPVGLDQFSEGGHGSGFDRVGAFQVGFLGGAERCEDLLRDPLPLSPARFFTVNDRDGGGNAPWGYGESELFGLLPGDLNLYWGSDVDGTAARFEPLTLVPVQSVGEVDCERLTLHFDHGAALCLDDNSVYINEPAAFDLYRQDLFGDFSVGYLLGVAWAEAAQRSLGSDKTGEGRELLNDCLAGAWVQTDIPVDFELPLPRHVERTTRISPGDLDETVRTMILIGDAATDENVLGTPFEKIEAFRDGLLGGVDFCLAVL